jgi:cyclic pyranopterin monophosphate synthase
VNSLCHFDDQGASRMVDVGSKPVSTRRARASAQVLMAETTLQCLKDRDTRKGDVLEVARLAGIMGSKRTADLIPLCHPLPLDSVTIDYSFPNERTVRIEVEARVAAKTGVEMEAMTAAAVTALTIYDMCKGLDRGMTIEHIQLEEKEGGKSGLYRRDDSAPAAS